MITHFKVRLLLAALSVAACAQTMALTEITQSEILSSDSIRNLTDDTVYKNNAAITEAVGNYKLAFDGANKSHSLTFDSHNGANMALIWVDTLKFSNLNVLEVKNAKQELQPAKSAGNLLRGDSGIECSSIEKIYFHDNWYRQEVSLFYVDSNGVLLKDIGEIRVENNRRGHDVGTYAAQGGLFTCIIEGGFLIENTGKVFMANNTVDGAAWGGMICALDGGKVEWRNVGEITIKNTRMTNASDWYFGGLGGAIFATSTLSFVNCGNTLFEENIVVNGTGREMTGFPIVGGAISVASINGDRIDMALFSADKGNIVFRGNQLIDNGKVYLDSVYIDSSVIDLHVRAQDGKEVAFYDKVVADNSNLIIFNGEETDPDRLNVYGMDKSPSFAGTIRFSGELLDQYIVQGDANPTETDAEYQERRWNSRYSYLGVDTTMHQGTMIVEHEAAIGMAPEVWDAQKTTMENVQALALDKSTITFKKDTTFRLDNPLLRLTSEGMMMGKDLIVKNKETVFQTDGTGVFVGGKVDMSNGVAYDFDFTLPLAQSGITIASQELSLGGDFIVADSTSSYKDKFWAVDRKFLVLDDITQSRDGSDFDQILSRETESNEVRDPFDYKGDWSMEWDGDDLYALWTNKGGIEEVDPEDKATGSLVENSLWVTLSNMKALSDVASQQVNYQRFLKGPCRHVWVSALGDFINQDTNGTTNGYNYHGYGVAAGMDSIACKNFVGGVAFGYMEGDMNTRLYNANSDLDSVMATIYGGYRKVINDKTDFYWVTSLSAVHTSNDMRTSFDNGDSTTGKWNNFGFLLETKATWNYALTPTWFLSPHVGLEYAYEERESFDESGSVNAARHFGSADLSNLRLPVGIACTKRHQFENGQFLTNTFDVSLLFDLVRSNPEAMAHSLVNDFQWKVDAANPAREALRVSWNAFYQLDKKWGVFGGYNAEFRNNAINQQGNAGISYTF